MQFINAVANDLQLSNTHITVEQIKSFIARCRVWPYEWGVILADGNDMHIHVLSDYRKKVFLRKPLKEVAFLMFAEYPVIKTSVMKTKPEAYQFDLRIGWKLSHETNEAWHLTMTKEDFRYV